jgi:hypothetical protein
MQAVQPAGVLGAAHVRLAPELEPDPELDPAPELDPDPEPDPEVDPELLPALLPLEEPLAPPEEPLDPVPALESCATSADASVGSLPVRTSVAPLQCAEKTAAIAAKVRDPDRRMRVATT